MKKAITTVLIFALVLVLCSCASTTNQVALNNEPSTTVAPEPSDTISLNGYTVKIVDVHLTKDSNGEAIVAIEYEYTNDNDAPQSFSMIGQTKVFQGGVECFKDQMYLERDFDWDTNYLEIKGGATISVFVAKPLRNTEDSIEVVFELWDMMNGKMLGSASKSFDLQ